MVDVIHKELASGCWQQMSLMEQMANIGSEVERAFHWKKKNQSESCMNAFERALELIDLTLESPQNKFCLKEIARAREMLADIFCGPGEFAADEHFIRKYFLQFALAVRKNT